MSYLVQPRKNGKRRVESTQNLLAYFTDDMQRNVEQRPSLLSSLVGIVELSFNSKASTIVQSMFLIDWHTAKTTTMPSAQKARHGCFFQLNWVA
mmetsp:Transcript_30213/g.48788  ORF Transcript_30213/g.48788 Transcript_30213/m.48788 type:complete len:94 (-) Transcript_30213:19-300(-)